MSLKDEEFPRTKLGQTFSRTFTSTIDRYVTKDITKPLLIFCPALLFLYVNFSAIRYLDLVASGLLPNDAVLPLLLIGGLIASPGARAQSSANEAPSSPSAYARGHVLVRYRGTAGERKRRLAAGVSVPDALARLRANPRVAYANPDYLVRAAAGC